VRAPLLCMNPLTKKKRNSKPPPPKKRNIVATGATMTTTAARQLLRGRSPFRGEREHTPCSLFGERMRCAARVKNLSKNEELRL
jgi:hypothetical protein